MSKPSSCCSSGAWDRIIDAYYEASMTYGRWVSLQQLYQVLRYSGLNVLERFAVQLRNLASRGKVKNAGRIAE